MQDSVWSQLSVLNRSHAVFDRLSHNLRVADWSKIMGNGEKFGNESLIILLSTVLRNVIRGTREKLCYG